MNEAIIVTAFGLVDGSKSLSIYEFDLIQDQIGFPTIIFKKYQMIGIVLTVFGGDWCDKNQTISAIGFENQTRSCKPTILTQFCTDIDTNVKSPNFSYLHFSTFFAKSNFFLALVPSIVQSSSFFHQSSRAKETL